MKKNIFKFCYYINLSMYLLYIVAIVATLFNLKEILFFFTNEIFVYVRLFISIPIFVIWVWSLIIWSKFDKSITQFLLNFFLIGLYTPFYCHKIIKNRWI